MTTPTPPSDLIARARRDVKGALIGRAKCQERTDWDELADVATQAAYAVVRERIEDPKLPFAIALAVQNSHYRANGIAEKDELDAFTEQYVKDARTSLEAIRSALKQRIDP